MGRKIGLDFGTSNSGVAVFEKGQVRLLPIDKSNLNPEIVKTILYISRDQQYYIGQEAVTLYYKHNVNRLRRYVKKWAGEIDYVGAELRYVRDIYVYVDELSPGRLFQYLKTALRKENGSGVYQGTQVFERYYDVSDLIQAYLAVLKRRAEEELGEPITGVTLGRPVNFSSSPEMDLHSQQILHQAALGAGFEEVEFETEPVAAALFYEQRLSKSQNVVVFDFGGGTLDIAIMRLGDPKKRKVFASGGIDIAGTDFDRAIIQKRLLPQFGLEQARYQPEIYELIQAIPDWAALPDLSTPMNRQNIEKAIQKKVASARLKTLLTLIFDDLAFSFYNQVEIAKIALSTHGAAVISIDDPNIHLWELYTRVQFEKDIADYQDRIEAVLMNTLEFAGLDVHQIDAVVKTGGSSNIPLFTGMLNRIFGSQKIIASDSFSSVSAGLAIRASQGAIETN